MINERRLREKVFAVAWDMWVDEGSPGYCRAILSIYAELTNQDLDEVEKEWEKATEGLSFDETYVDKELKSIESGSMSKKDKIELALFLIIAFGMMIITVVLKLY